MASSNSPSDSSAGNSSTRQNNAQIIQSTVNEPTMSFPRPDLTAKGVLPTEASKWNTNSLGWRLGVDAASAMTAAAAVCPVVTVIDRAIIEKAAKGMAIRESLSTSVKSLITRPHRFIVSTPFLLIYTLYSCTYITANLIDTSVSAMNGLSFEAVSAGPVKFVATALVNMSICVYKDSRFAKIFGAQGQDQGQTSQQQQQQATTSKSPRNPAVCHAVRQPITPPTPPPKIPKISLSLFCLRDSLTIFASFNLPQLIGPKLPDFLASTPSSKAALAQFSIPAGVQLFSTPLHLLGLDLFNRQPVGGLPAADRWARVKRDWAPSFLARVGRILPAYGLGGVLNTRMRERMMRGIES